MTFRQALYASRSRYGPRSLSCRQALQMATIGGAGCLGRADEIGSLMFAHHPGDTVNVTWTDTTGQTQTASVRLASGPPA